MVLVYLFVPDTSRVTLEEIDMLFANRVPARQFKSRVKEERKKAAEAAAAVGRIVQSPLPETRTQRGDEVVRAVN